MSIKGCIAMVLAGGRGERLGALTRYYPKPAIHFGGKNRIIDYTLKNCKDSGINTVGILSQYFSSDLHAYIETAYDCGSKSCGVNLLPPRDYFNSYKGSADAVYKNITFIERFRPECVLILAGDHIYRMDYAKMVAFHRETGADVTIASTRVPIKEASKFGILNADKTGRVCYFEEKPLYPNNYLASMGIYVFKWEALKAYLLDNSKIKQVQHDFGKDIIPRMLYSGESVYTYKFHNYWRDVGSVDSLLDANIDQIRRPSLFRDDKRESAVSGRNSQFYRSPEAVIRQSVISDGCSVFGKVEQSVLSGQVTVGKGAEIVDSYIMPGAYIGNHVKIHRAVVGTRAIIMDNTVIGADDGTDFFMDGRICAKGVSLVSPWLYIEEGMRFQGGSHIFKEVLQEYTTRAYMTVVSCHDHLAGQFQGAKAF